MWLNLKGQGPRRAGRTRRRMLMQSRPQSDCLTSGLVIGEIHGICEEQKFSFSIFLSDGSIQYFFQKRDTLSKPCIDKVSNKSLFFSKSASRRKRRPSSSLFFAEAFFIWIWKHFPWAPQQPALYCSTLKRQTLCTTIHVHLFYSFHRSFNEVFGRTWSVLGHIFSLVVENTRKAIVFNCQLLTYSRLEQQIGSFMLATLIRNTLS